MVEAFLKLRADRTTDGAVPFEYVVLEWCSSVIGRLVVRKFFCLLEDSPDGRVVLVEGGG